MAETTEQAQTRRKAMLETKVPQFDSPTAYAVADVVALMAEEHRHTLVWLRNTACNPCAVGNVPDPSSKGAVHQTIFGQVRCRAVDLREMLEALSEPHAPAGKSTEEGPDAD